MLYLFALLAVLLVVSTSAYAMRATTTDRCVACLTEQHLDDMTSFVAAGDKASFGAYFQSQKCFKFKPGIDVTVTKMPGMFGGKAEAVYNGIKFWTYREGLTNYRTTP